MMLSRLDIKWKPYASILIVNQFQILLYMKCLIFVTQCNLKEYWKMIRLKCSVYYTFLLFFFDFFFRLEKSIYGTQHRTFHSNIVL